MASESWDYGVVALLDILGFSELVKADAGSPEPKHLSKLAACLRKARQSPTTQTLEIKIFSDSIIIAGRLSPTDVINVICAIAELQRIFIPDKFLIRGAVALGKHYSDVDSIYSEALVRAYNLEKEQARFPRVVIDEHLLDWFINTDDTTEKMKQVLYGITLKDRDNFAFVHYLDVATIDQHKELISSYDLKKISASVLEKIQWLATYHNHTAEALNPDLVISGRFANGFQRLDV